MRYLLIIALITGFCSCDKDAEKPGLVDAYVPVYGDKGELKNIIQQTPQPIIHGGKIATLGNYLYQVEEGEGIHIINIANPSQPQKISFIKIPLCNEVTLRGNFLYTNNVNDLLVLNISNISNISVASRTENAFPSQQAQYPPQTGVYFECADNSKGLVLRWELKKVNNPTCKR
ncbi:MAG: hypothetical protein H7X88_11110 [Gloeobacteraceae cyanobacterium ES-bin-316]|nr:hypothetical protein [Ferruginibacter sp.]